ncbi:hypothetical protein YC2023_017742 [Brassica napus]
MVEPESTWDEKHPKMAADSPLWPFWCTACPEDCTDVLASVFDLLMDFSLRYITKEGVSSCLKPCFTPVKMFEADQRMLFSQFEVREFCDNLVERVVKALKDTSKIQKRGQPHVHLLLNHPYSSVKNSKVKSDLVFDDEETNGLTCFEPEHPSSFILSSQDFEEDPLDYSHQGALLGTRRPILMVEPESTWDEKNLKMAAYSPLWHFWILKLSEALSYASTHLGQADHPKVQFVRVERPAGVWIVLRASLSFSPCTSTTRMNLDSSRRIILTEHFLFLGVVSSKQTSLFRWTCASYQATERNHSFVGLVRHIKQQLKSGSIKRLSAPLVSPFNPSVLPFGEFISLSLAE